MLAYWSHCPAMTSIVFIHVFIFSFFSLSSSFTVSLDVWPLVLFVLFLSLIVPTTHFVPAHRISVSLNYYKEKLIVWLSGFLLFIFRDSCAATIHYTLYLLGLFWLPSIGAVKLVYYNIGKHLVSDGCHIQLTLFTVCILSCQTQEEIITLIINNMYYNCVFKK